MLLATIFAPFSKERPICVMARAVLARLLDASRLEALCARTAQQQQTRARLFSSLGQLMSAVVLGGSPTVHAAYQANTEAMGGATTALDNKLDRLATDVAAALVRDSAALAEPGGQTWRARHPRWVPGQQINGLDGPHLAPTEHRLKAWRGTWAAPLPGPALVVLAPQRLLLTDALRHEDGQAQARRVLAQVLPHLQAEDLWSDDRHFCPLGLRGGMARRGAAFVVRHHGQGQGELVGRLTRQGVSRRGPVSAPALRVRDPDGGETMRVRRITVPLTEPTRNGDTTLHLRSNVPPPRAAAAPLARGYGTRWSREPACFEITTTWACEINTLGYPNAALLTFGLALFAYNAVALIKAALRRAHGRQKIKDEVSSYSLSLEMGRTYDGLMSAIPAPHWALCRELSAKECANTLRDLASSVPRSRYQKHPRGPKKPPPERTAYRSGQHVSTAQLLAQR